MRMCCEAAVRKQPVPLAVVRSAGFKGFYRKTTGMLAKCAEQEAQKVQLATDLPAPRVLSIEEFQRATDEARELSKRLAKATADVEGLPEDWKTVRFS